MYFETFPQILNSGKFTTLNVIIYIICFDVLNSEYIQ